MIAKILNLDSKLIAKIDSREPVHNGHNEHTYDTPTPTPERLELKRERRHTTRHNTEPHLNRDMHVHTPCSAAPPHAAHLIRGPQIPYETVLHTQHKTMLYAYNRHNTYTQNPHLRNTNAMMPAPPTLTPTPPPATTTSVHATRPPCSTDRHGQPATRHRVKHARGTRTRHPHINTHCPRP